jgi:cellulose biosynthesis protein BcsQ
MPLEGSYVIWNNRGGSGKTNLTYHLAIKYAYRNPDKTVLVIDMCPQADLSHAFLGDDEHGQDYVSQIGSLKKDPMILDGEQRIPRTISGYLDLYTSVGLPTNVDPRTFLFNISKFNNQLPRNIYLLCGDTSLELLGKALDLKRSSNTISPYTNPWRTITQSLRVFVQKIGERRGIKLMAFIDTNSSFNISTEIALTAADRIILPVSEDHLHRNGFEYLFSLLYGFSQPSSIYYYYRHYSFYYRADENGVKLPKIHLILSKESSLLKDSNLNLSSTKTDEIEKCWQFIYDIYTKHRYTFEQRSSSD